jgi:hypothetical protein
VLILGATTAATATPVHEIQVTRGWAATLPPGVLARLRCTVVDELAPIAQRHRITGLATT